jgi:hypothetical protein
MVELVAEDVSEGVPEDYPGRVNKFPEGASHIVYAIYGVQSKSPEITKQHAETLAALLGADGGAQQIERGSHVDAQGFYTELVMGYWLNREPYWAFSKQSDFSKWWDELPVDPVSDLGFFKEVALTHKERFNYAAGTEDKVASAAILGLQGSDKFGYWGSYRDRLPASKDDQFNTPLESMPAERNDATKGRRLTTQLPDNICFIREGQGLANCGEAEREIWNTQMAKRVGRWTKFLSDDPENTGCISIRDCLEFDTKTGVKNDRQSQNAFLLSLDKIERAARTVCEHLEVRKSFINMYTEPKFTPQMHVWVEVHILKSDDLEVEYINCHPQTGFLRFFESTSAT